MPDDPTLNAFKDPSTAADTLLVAAVPGKRIVVTSYWIQAEGVQNVAFVSGTSGLGTNTVISASKRASADGGGAARNYYPSALFATVTGDGLYIRTAQAVITHVEVTYRLIDGP